jgi:hypothetical protein
MSDVVLERIAGWEAAGLIDATTAERLRATEKIVSSSAPEQSAPRQNLVTTFLNPPLTIVEVFSYLGGAFVLAAWAVLMGRLSSEATGSTADWLKVVAFAVPATVFFVGGMVLHPRSPRLSRAAGVSFTVSTIAIGAGVTANADIFADAGLATLVGAIAALVAAIAYRWLHPAILTELGLLSTITWFTWSLLALTVGELSVARVLLYGPIELSGGLVGVIVSAVAWIVCAVVIGLIGLAEARAGTADAGRRAALARFWAGSVLVIGVATSVMRTVYLPESGEGQRVIEPWIGELIVLGISAILVERAFRRGAGAFVLPAALGVIWALTDFNFSYVSKVGGTEVALLIEGLLLIAIAFAAERIGRRVSASRTPSDPPPVVDAEASSA